MSTYKKSLSLLAAGLTLALVGCHHDAEKTTVTPVVAVTPMTVQFADVTDKAGLRFKHVNGTTKNKMLPETMGSGLAWIDYDGDGYQDLFIVNSREWTADERKQAGLPPASDAPGEKPTCHLYHNNGNGTFTDVTKQAHLDMTMYGMGVAVGDFDNDGHPDLYVTGLSRNYLFRNNGNGTFTEMADKAGLTDGGWSTSAAWVDYNKDGKLDLLVAHYVQWSPATDINFSKNGHRSYGTPQSYKGQPLALYRNDGNGHFTNVTKDAGLLLRGDGQRAQGKSLGVALCDYDNDGWPDFAIANDTEPNYLFHNNGDGTFKEVGVEQGVAYGDTASARGAMGIDTCDYDHKGYESFVIGNFSNQMLALYHNDGGIFRDVSSQTGVGPPSLLSLSFGCFFCDLDNDGWADLFVANGHIDDDISEDQKQVEYAESPLVYRNQGNGNFASVGSQIGPDLQRKMVARGTAYADYELRGWPAIAVSTSNGPAHLFRNGGNGNHALRLELEGTKSNRSAVGAAVEVKMGGTTQIFHVRSGSSYCSQSELPITVGLGTANQADGVTIKWPSGQVSNLGALAAGSIYQVVEGQAAPTKRAFGQPIVKSTARR